VENDRVAAWYKDQPAAVLDIQRQPGANIVQTVQLVKAALPRLQNAIPSGIQLTIVTDRTETIRASVRDVQITLIMSVILVVAVIFLFLRSPRATFIPAVALPLSLVGTFGVMQQLGYALDNLSLMALTIATGFVVDDAIVMIENIARFIEKGESPIEAALHGSEQIGFTIISLTVSLIAVLIPLLFMGDVVGRLFREFAVTLAITILISAVVSLTLVPMMSARWLGDSARHGGRLGATVQRRIDRVVAGYDRWLGVVLKHQPLTLLVALATLLLTVLLYVVIPKGLFPTQDTGQLQARIEAAQGASYPRMRDLQHAAAEAILADPAVATLSSFVGVDAANNTMLHTGRMLVNLKPKSERDDQTIVMQRLRERVGRVAGVTLYLQPTQDLTIDAETGPTEFRVSLEGADTATVTDWALKLVQRLHDMPAVRNAMTDAGATGLAAFVDIDRDTASRLGITASAIDDALYSAFGQRIVSTIFTETNQYRVILEARPGVLTTPDALGTLRLKAGTGSSTPLSAIATVREAPAPLQVTHVAQYPATTIGFDTAPGVALGKAVDSIRHAAKDIGLPSGVTITFLGAAGAYESSLTSQLWLILAAVICVYIVLGVLYESYIHPLTILSTLPSAGVGALLALMIGGHDLGVIGIIGIILLIGIVKKNAIMMIDFAIVAEREQGMSAHDAIYKACLLRFRPIMMTTMCALFGAVPLAIGAGYGAALRQPLGISIIGGLVLSQLLTLYTTPVVYVYLDRFRLWCQRMWRRTRVGAAAPQAR
jgi:multidrug efflux pump